MPLSGSCGDFKGDVMADGHRLEYKKKAPGFTQICKWVEDLKGSYWQRV